MDHNTKQTTWVRPAGAGRQAAPPPQPSSRSSSPQVSVARCNLMQIRGADGLPVPLSHDAAQLLVHSFHVAAQLLAQFHHVAAQRLVCRAQAAASCTKLLFGPELDDHTVPVLMHTEQLLSRKSAKLLRPCPCQKVEVSIFVGTVQLSDLFISGRAAPQQLRATLALRQQG